MLFAALVVVTLFLTILTFFNTLFWPLMIFPLFLYFVFLFIGSVEKSSFFVKLAVSKLTEGDWLAENVERSGKKILGKKTLEKKDITKLHHLGVSSVLVKEGIPFVPSFLFAYLLIVFGSKLISFVLEVIFS